MSRAAGRLAGSPLLFWRPGWCFSRLLRGLRERQLGAQRGPSALSPALNSRTSLDVLGAALYALCCQWVPKVARALVTSIGGNRVFLP